MKPPEKLAFVFGAVHPVLPEFADDQRQRQLRPGVPVLRPGAGYVSGRSNPGGQRSAGGEQGRLAQLGQQVARDHGVTKIGGDVAARAVPFGVQGDNAFEYGNREGGAQLHRREHDHQRPASRQRAVGCQQAGRHDDGKNQPGREPLRLVLLVVHGFSRPPTSSMYC